MGNAGFVPGTYHQIGHVGKHGESRLLSKVFFLKAHWMFQGFWVAVRVLLSG